MPILSQKQKSDEDTNPLLLMKSRDSELQRMSDTLMFSWKITCPQLKVDASLQSYDSVVGEVEVRNRSYTHEQNSLTGAEWME